MTLADIVLLIKFLIEGFSHIRKFIQDEEIRGAFLELKDSASDEGKEIAAQKIASLIYMP